jgi:hypothetical protein
MPGSNILGTCDSGLREWRRPAPNKIIVEVTYAGTGTVIDECSGGTSTIIYTGDGNGSREWARVPWQEIAPFAPTQAARFAFYKFGCCGSAQGLFSNPLPLEDYYDAFEISENCTCSDDCDPSPCGSYPRNQQIPTAIGIALSGSGGQIDFFAFTEAEDIGPCGATFLGAATPTLTVSRPEELLGEHEWEVIQEDGDYTYTWNFKVTFSISSEE